MSFNVFQKLLVFISIAVSVSLQHSSPSTSGAILLTHQIQKSFLQVPDREEERLLSFCSASEALNQTSPSSSLSNGLVYKFDQVRVIPKKAETEDEIHHGFVRQSCHPHHSDPNDEPMCIFLNSGFNQARGVVILTRPSVFKAGLEQFSAFKSDAPPQVTPEARRQVPFVVTDMPHKGGKGAVANRKLHPGDLVITDHATIIVSVETRVWSRSDWADVRKQMIDLLPFKTRAFFATLHGVGETETDWITTAIDRNAFETKIGPDAVPHFAVVPEPSRLNHDCRPNTAYWFDDETLQVYMYALRDVSPGEELTIAYRDMKQSRQERQDEIHHYGFECSCSLCSLPVYLVEVSDHRIKMIEELSAELVNWEGNSSATPAMAERVIELYKLERLDNGMEEAYTMASLAYNAIGDTEEAMLHASISHEKGLISGGPKWPDRWAVEQLKTRPASHWSYMLRVNKAKTSSSSQSL